MKIYLEHSKGFFGRLVSFFTKDKVNHCFLGFDTLFIEARLTGVKLFDIKEFRKRKIKRVYEYSKAVDKIALLTSVLYLKNKNYDIWLSVSHLFKKFFNKADRYNCVEVVRYVLNFCDILNYIQDTDKPADLEKMKYLRNWKEEETL